MAVGPGTEGSDAGVFGGAPTGGTTVGAEGKEFVGRAEDAVAIVV